MLTFSNLKVLAFLLTLCQFSFLVSARPQFSTAEVHVKRDGNLNIAELRTNSARIQAGLTPLKPRSLYNPTRVAARSPGSSPLPPITGQIQVRRAASGSSIGFVAKTPGGLGIGVVASNNQRMTISFSSGASSPFDISITSGGSYPTLGFAGDDFASPVDLSPYNRLTATNPTPQGATRTAVGNTYGGTSESSVWSYSGAQLTAIWKNSGSVTNGKLWYYPATDVLALVRVSQGSGYEVTFSVV